MKAKGKVFVKIWLKVLEITAVVTLFYRKLKARFNEFCIRHKTDPARVKKLIKMIVKIGFIITMGSVFTGGNNQLVEQLLDAFD